MTSQAFASASLLALALAGCTVTEGASLRDEQPVKAARSEPHAEELDEMLTL